MMNKILKVKCSACGKDVEKLFAEIKRRKKQGKTNFYCNNKCAGKHKVIHLLPYKDHFTKNKYTRKPDRYSNFRWYIKQIKKGSKKRDQIHDIDIEYLAKLWDEQDGLCPFTKQKLILRTHYNYKSKKIVPNLASLDRIDSTKGYIKGNIRFVCLMYNYAKNIFSDKDVIEFCNLVMENRNEFLEKIIQKNKKEIQ